MNPVMTERGPFIVMGIVTRIRRGSETPELFEAVWARFESYRQELEPLAEGKQYYGVSFATDDEEVTDYLAGMAVSSDAPTLRDLEKRPVPSGRFAVFESPVEAIGVCYRHVFTVWLPDADVAFNPAVPVFEEYPESTPAQPVRIHIPVQGPTDAARR